MVRSPASGASPPPASVVVSAPPSAASPPPLPAPSPPHAASANAVVRPAATATNFRVRMFSSSRAETVDPVGDPDGVVRVGGYRLSRQQMFTLTVWRVPLRLSRARGGGAHQARSQGYRSRRARPIP